MTQTDVVTIGVIAALILIVGVRSGLRADGGMNCGAAHPVQLYARVSGHTGLSRNDSGDVSPAPLRS
jgi:hypothetical protein